MTSTLLEPILAILLCVKAKVVPNYNEHLYESEKNMYIPEKENYFEVLIIIVIG